MKESDKTAMPLLIPVALTTDSQESYPKVAPSLQQQREELAKKQIQDSLRHKIDSRPTKEDLVEHNILKNTNAAPAIQAQQADLERNRLQNVLGQKIQDRPQPEQLVQQGILQNDE
ncbi:hypothetical protein INT43_006495 [Umbelopsis isabellina]|uniref:RPEL repeat protein n=1 Tax=Mortierella isabellina TaxID=91625 RepID=A0A8H7ULS6_MORIS|nr:hypothetical protein INT43_006495 [Umbelopsis isabellina]